MRDHFHEVEVVLRYLLNLVLETLVHFTIFHEHVEHRVLTVVDLPELLFYMVEIVRVPES